MFICPSMSPYTILLTKTIASFCKMFWDFLILSYIQVLFHVNQIIIFFKLDKILYCNLHWDGKNYKVICELDILVTFSLIMLAFWWCNIFSYRPRIFLTRVSADGFVFLLLLSMLHSPHCYWSTITNCLHRILCFHLLFCHFLWQFLTNLSAASFIFAF